MNIYEYLNINEQRKRILIVLDMGKEQLLFSRYESENKKMVRNVVCMTLHQAAEHIYIYEQSEAGYEMEYALPDNKQSMMIFRDVLLNNIAKLKYFTAENMLDMATVKDIYEKVQFVRGNGWSEGKVPADSERISDIRYLIDKYEEQLDNKKLMDEVGLYRYVCKLIDSWKDKEKELYYALGASVAYLKEVIENYSAIERKLLMKLITGKDNQVDMFPDSIMAKDIAQKKPKALFYKGYGSYNEACYVANDILEKKLELGSVELIYSSSEQLPYIIAGLSGNGIRINITSDYPAADNEYISLVRRIIDWAEEDYSEKALEHILASSVICAKAGANDYILKARNRRNNSFILGWGYERNLQFVENERRQQEEESIYDIKALLDMHNSLLDIFGEQLEEGGQISRREYDKVQPVTVYRKLVDFVAAYTYKRKEYSEAVSSLYKITEIMEYESRELPLAEALELIKEFISDITMSDKASSAAVNVHRLNGWTVLERPYVYMTGLSLKDMQGNTMESPVLHDNELEEFLGEGYKPTIKNVSRLREKNIYRTLYTFAGREITFGYSFYDTVGFCESNASNLYRELLLALSDKKIEQLPEFVYGNPCEAVMVAADEGNTANEGNASDGDIVADEGIASDVEKAKEPVRLKTSNSTLEVLLDCPKRYAYRRILNIPDNEYNEIDYSGWLDARLTGSFFHEIAEKYVKEKLIKPSEYEPDELVDKDLIRDIADKIKKRMLKEVPVAFDKLADKKTEELIQYAVLYFAQLHKELKQTGWQVLMAEQPFEAAKYKVRTYDDVEYDFSIDGIIDRIDYYVSADEKKVYLRISDYKTGRKSSKQAENSLGKLLQYTVYDKALMESGCYKDEHNNDTLLNYIKKCVAGLQKNPQMEEWEYVFESFRYVFPMERKDTEPLIITADEIEGINLSRLKTILTAINRYKEYPDHIDLYNYVRQYKESYEADDIWLEALNNAMDKFDSKGNYVGINTDEISHCRYCEYQNLCERRKAGEL